MVSMPETIPKASPALSNKARGKKRARSHLDPDPDVDLGNMSGGRVVPAKRHSTYKPNTKDLGRGEGSEKVDESRKKGLYLAFLDNALAERKKRNLSAYQQLISELRAFTSQPSPSTTSIPRGSTTFKSESDVPNLSTLLTWLQVLPHVVSQLDFSHSTLVETILDIPWTILDSSSSPPLDQNDEQKVANQAAAKRIPAAYVRFLGALCGARTEWAPKVTERCVIGFKHSMFKSLKLSPVIERLSLTPTLRAHTSRLHSLLRHLISILPTLTSSLLPYLDQHFPFKREPRDSHVVYVASLFEMVNYVPEIEHLVLEMVVVRAVKLDVEIQIDLEDWESEGLLFNSVFAESDPFNRHLHSPSPSPPLLPRSRSSSVSSLSFSDPGFSDFESEGSGLGDEGGGGEDEAELNGKAKTPAEKRETFEEVREKVRKLDGILKTILDFWEKKGGDGSSRIDVSNSHSSGKPGNESKPSSNHHLTSLPSPKEELKPFPQAPNSPTASQFSDDLGRIYRQRVFRSLLDIFDRTLLRAFKTSHVQFLIFWYSSLESSFSDQFIGTLIGRALFDDESGGFLTGDNNNNGGGGGGDGKGGGPTGGIGARVTAMGYVASYLSRAKFVERREVRKVVRLCCAYLDDGLDRFGNDLALEQTARRRHQSYGPANPSTQSSLNSPKSAREYAVWYAVVQSLFYIFCFRWEDLLDDDDDEGDENGETGLWLNGEEKGSDGGSRWMSGLESLKRAISSRLNPLKICSEGVCEQFSVLASKTNFFYCHSIIAANRRSATQLAQLQQSLSSTDTNPISSSQASAQSLNEVTASSFQLPTTVPSFFLQKALEEAELENAFPFDPYKLPLSRKYVDGIYREWRSAEDEDGDETSNLGGELDTQYLHPKREEERLGNSFESMSL